MWFNFFFFNRKQGDRMPSDFHSWPMSLSQYRQPTVLSVPFQKYFMRIHKHQSFLFNHKIAALFLTHSLLET